MATVIALGIKSADADELNVIASDPDSTYSMMIDDFSLLDQILDLITDSMCASQGNFPIFVYKFGSDSS